MNQVQVNKDCFEVVGCSGILPYSHRDAVNRQICIRAVLLLPIIVQIASDLALALEDTQVAG